MVYDGTPLPLLQHLHTALAQPGASLQTHRLEGERRDLEAQREMVRERERIGEKEREREKEIERQWQGLGY